MATTNITQYGVEILGMYSAPMRITQYGIEVLGQYPTFIRLTQFGVEVLGSITPLLEEQEEEQEEQEEEQIGFRCKTNDEITYVQQIYFRKAWIPAITVCLDKSQVQKIISNGGS